MKLDAYKYEAGSVKLEFSFAQGEKNRENKITFIELLEQALKDLKDEMGKSKKFSD